MLENDEKFMMKKLIFRRYQHNCHLVVKVYLMNGRMLHSSTYHTFDRKYKYMKKYLSVNLSVNTSIRACSQLFPIVDLRYVLTCFKAEKIPSLWAFVSLESKSNFTIFPTSLIKKSQFRDISCNFLIMMFITFNRDINRGFLVYMFSLRFSGS